MARRDRNTLDHHARKTADSIGDFLDAHYLKLSETDRGALDTAIRTLITLETPK